MPEYIQQVNVKSPDLKIADGYPFLEEGAEIKITAEAVDSNSVEEHLRKDPLFSQVARNIRETEIDSKEAIQYDYSYEMVSATNTTFIKDGVCYVVNFRYASGQGREKNWYVYQKLIDTFQIKTWEEETAVDLWPEVSWSGPKFIKEKYVLYCDSFYSDNYLELDKSVALTGQRWEAVLYPSSQEDSFSLYSAFQQYYSRLTKEGWERSHRVGDFRLMPLSAVR